MSKELGLLTKDEENFLIDLICSKITFKNRWLKMFKRTIVKKIILYADNTEAEKINASWKAELKPIIKAAIEKRYEDVRLYVNDLLNKKIDIKKIDEATELEAFDLSTKTIAIWIYILTKKS